MVEQRLIGSAYGQPATGAQLVGQREGTRPSTLTHAASYEEPVVTDRSRKCKGNDDTCNGWRAKDTEFCAGHLRSQGVID